MTKQMGLNKLISLTFDEDPAVRKQAAQQLSHYDDPSATFALLELSYDKNGEVSGIARGILGTKKKSQPQLLSFADVFSAGAEKKEEKKEKKIPETKKEKMLKPLEELFEKKLGKGEKAEMVKSKMMPTLEKIYMKAVEKNGGSGEERGREVQAMLTKYLDRVASGPDEIIVEDAIIVNEGDAEAPEGKPKQETIAEELEQIGTKEPDMKGAHRELEEVEASDVELLGEANPREPEPEVPEVQGTQTVFKYAFDTMMASEGDEKVLKDAMKGMMRKAEQDIKLAFNIAKSKYKTRNITHLTELESGMRNVNTLPLNVKGVEHKEYQRTKKKRDTFTRIVVADNEGNEGVLYLFDGRGAHIKPGMHLKVEKGFAKTFDFSSETALTVSNKGRVYIVL